MADARPLRTRTKEVNYKEPGATQGLYKIRPDAPPLSSDDESDGEGTSRPRDGGSRKKAKTNASTSQKPRASPAAKAAIEPGDSLFDIVRDKPIAVPMAVNQWWSDYAYRQAWAVEKLVNLILESSGFRGKFPSAVFKGRDVDADAQVESMVGSMKSQTCEAHMTGKDGKSAKLRRSLEEFWRKLIEVGPKEELTELYNNPVWTWISALSVAQLQPLRMSAVLAALAMMVGLASVGKDTIVDMTNKDRLLTAERSKSSGGNAQKQKRLHDEVEELARQKMKLETQMDELFNATFMHRIRDSIATIRAWCVTSLGEMVQLYGSKFLENQYLKYLGWGLNDKDSPTVRSACLDAIANIYGLDVDKELEKFVQRFRNRIVEMCRDRDLGVARAAIELGAILAKRELLEEAQVEALYGMIVWDDEDLRSGAAELIAEVYINGDLAKAYEDSGSRGNRTEYMLKGVVELLHHSAREFEDLLPMCEALSEASSEWGWTDWALMVRTLEDEDEQESLYAEQKETLARMLAASLASSSDSDVPSSAPKPGGRRGSGAAEDKTGISVLVAALPGLIGTLGLDSKILSALLCVVANLPVHKDLSTKHAKSLGAVVDAVADTVLKQQDDALLRQAADALSRIASSPPGVVGLLTTNFAPLAETLSKQALAGVAAIAKGDKATATQALGLRRAAIVGGRVDLAQWRPALVKEAMDVVRSVAKHPAAAQAHGAGQYAVALAGATLLWRMARHVRGGAVDEDVEKASEARSEMVELCGKIAAAKVNVSLRAQAVLTVGDLLTMRDFGKGADVPRAKELMPLAKAAAELYAQDSGSEAWKEACKTVLHCADGEVEDELLRKVAMAIVDPGKTRQSGKEDDKTIHEILASFTTSRDWHNDMIRYASNKVADVASTWSNPDKKVAEIWLGSQQLMYMRIMEGTRNHEHDSDATLRMVNSVALLQLGGETAATYVKGGLEWALQALPSQDRLGFLEVVSVCVPKLLPNAAAEMLNLLERLCSNAGVSLKDVSGPLSHICKLRHKLLEAVDGSRPAALAVRKGKSPATPASSRSQNRTQTPLSVPRLGWEEEEEEEEEEEGAGGSASKRRHSGGSVKASGGKTKVKKARKTGPVSSSDEDEEGFRTASSRSRGVSRN